jgi:flagellar hook-associated protein 2
MGTSIFTGNSGFDVQKVIDGFVKIESVRSDKLQQKTIDVTTRMSTLATMMGHAQTLTTSLSDLKDGIPNGVVGRTPLNVNLDVDTTAPSGRYNVKVNTLAQAAQGSTQVMPGGASTQVSTGAYNLVVDGTSYAFTLLAGATLSDLAEAIKASGAPVQASVVNTGSGAALALMGDNTGVSTGVAPTDTLRLDAPPPASAAETQPTFAVTQQPQNASVTINGVTVSRATNVVDDVIPGVTLNLTNESTLNEVIEIGRDTTQVKDKLKAFVDAYNTLRKEVNNQVDVAGGTDTSQLLTNDPVVRRLSRQLGDMLRLEGNSSAFRTLGSLGINVNRQGTLDFDEGKLKATVLVNPGPVTDFLAGTDGFASKAAKAISAFSNPLSGSLSKRTFELSDDVAKIQKEKAAADLRVDAFRERLIKQFASLQGIQSKMSGITNYLKASDNAASKG